MREPQANTKISSFGIQLIAEQTGTVHFPLGHFVK